MRAKMKVPEELQFMVNARMVQKTTNARMDGRVCVITGATSGVGYQAAKRLAEAGAHLVIVCRNCDKAGGIKQELEAAFGTQVDVIQADFCRLAEVRQAAAEIFANYPRVDVLINNAGMHNTRRRLSEDGIELTFAVNHIASFLLTSLLLPRMIESAPSRIIQINSEGHRFGGLDLNDLNWDKRKFSGLKAYGASKNAQLMTVWELADQLKGTGVTINAVHPGEVRTNIGMNNDWLYRAYKQTVLRWFLKDPAIAGSAIYYAAAAPEMAETSGVFFNLTIPEKPAPYALDRDLGKKVWAISEKLAGL